MNPQNLLDQFLGAGTSARAGQAVQNAKGGLANSGLGGVAGGLAAGGVLGLLVGNKKARKKVGKLAGGVVGYGGAAALGALAYRAYQNWQSGQDPAAQGQPPAQPQASAASAPAAQQPGLQIPPADSRFLPSAAADGQGRPFELALILAMIAAANADGHIGPEEQRQIFDRVGEMPLDAEDKAFVFDSLGKPPSLQEIAGMAGNEEQAAELYLASCLAIDIDHPAEEAYLEALAGRLRLAPELAAHLRQQAEGVSLSA